MPREIKSLNAVPLNLPSNQVNNFKDRLVKLIPSEIVTAYITIQGIIKGAEIKGDENALLWCVFIVLLIITPLYLYYATNVRKWGQIILTTVGFIIWVIVIGGPIQYILAYPAEFVGSIILILYTLFIPVLYKG